MSEFCNPVTKLQVSIKLTEKKYEVARLVTDTHRLTRTGVHKRCHTHSIPHTQSSVCVCQLQCEYKVAC